MIPRTIREVISASRKAVRDFGRTLEELGEILQQQQQHQRPQKIPLRVPVNRGHLPFPNGGPRGGSHRNFSTFRAAPTASFQLKFLKATYKPSLSSTFRSGIYQVQPFRQNGIKVGKNMYNHFHQHNSRMFSTFGSTTQQAVNNLSQGIRTFVLKGSEFSLNSINKLHVGSMNTNKTFAEQDMVLAARFSSSSDALAMTDAGSFVEFDVNSKSLEDLLPRAGIFDEDLCEDMAKQMQLVLDYQTQVLSEIGLFRENIGSTSFQCDGGTLRFYCPNCEPAKMEMLLVENGIKTGVVHEYSSRGSSYSSVLSSRESSISASSFPFCEGVLSDMSLSV